MNYIYISPEFPPNYANFIQQLRQNGVNVLGIGSSAYSQLTETVRQNLVEYYRVSDMHHYDELLRAVGYFTHGYGKIDFVESHNEYWLKTEARLRTDFNIAGPRLDTIDWIKQKSKMKQIYQGAGIQVARGKVLSSLSEAQNFAEEVGYPLIAKPDSGVGAMATYRLDDENELISFFDQPPADDYIFEEFIEGKIFSFDGLTDQDGEIVFYTVHVFSSGIMETVNENRDIYYYSLQDIPPEIFEAGGKVVKAFDVRARFFHLEFFETPDHRIVALEVNIRPPGGFTTDMFNYAHDFDIYAQYAQMISGQTLAPPPECRYYCAYVSRKNHLMYEMPHHKILSEYRDILMQHDPINPVWRNALGDYGYIIRSQNLEEIFAAIQQIQNPRARDW